MAANLRTDYVRSQRYFTDIVALYKRRPDLKAFMEILLSLGTIGVFAMFAIRPTLLTISNLLTEIKSKEETIAQMDEKITNLSAAQQILQQQKPVIDLLADAVPTDSKLDGYIRQVEGLIGRNSLQVFGLASGEITLSGTKVAQTKVNANPNQAKTQSDFPPSAVPIEINVSVAGGYPSIASFLNNLSNLRRPILFDTVNFATTQVESGETLVLTVGGRIPYINQK